MAAKANIVIDQGAEFLTTYTFLDENNDPIDFTGYTGAAQMRKSYTSSMMYPFQVALGNNGLVTLSMDYSSTEIIPAGRYVYDIEVLKDQKKSRIVEGIVTVTPGVTNV